MSNRLIIVQDLPSLRASDWKVGRRLLFVEDADAFYKFIEDSLDADDDSAVIKPDDRAEEDPGRWVLAVSGAGGGGGGGDVTDIRAAYVLKNGGDSPPLGLVHATVSEDLGNGNGMPLCISNIVTLVEGAYIEAYGYHLKGSAVGYESIFNNAGFGLMQLGVGAEHGVLVRSAAPTSVASGGGGAPIVWNDAIFDTDSYWSALDPTKLTIPAGRGGKYLMTVNVAARS